MGEGEQRAGGGLSQPRRALRSAPVQVHGQTGTGGTVRERRQLLGREQPVDGVDHGDQRCEPLRCGQRDRGGRMGAAQGPKRRHCGEEITQAERSQHHDVPDPGARAPPLLGGADLAGHRGWGG